jgi:hypothetical protein
MFVLRFNKEHPNLANLPKTPGNKKAELPDTSAGKGKERASDDPLAELNERLKALETEKANLSKRVGKKVEKRARDESDEEEDDIKVVSHTRKSPRKGKATSARGRGGAFVLPATIQPGFAPTAWKKAEVSNFLFDSA